MLMVIFIKVNGKTIWQMVLEHLLMFKELSLQENGLMISNMVMEKKVGIMVKQSTSVCSIKAKRMARVDLNGKMAASMKETS
jgi:ACR3 family arsenite efflux pump ArsB